MPRIIPTLGEDPNRTALIAEVDALYAEMDLPSPTVRYPIAPLGPLRDDLPVVIVELSNLTSAAAETYLVRGGSLTERFEAGIATREPLAGFLYASIQSSFLFLRQEDPVVRRRFSLAHEIGHLRLHVPAAFADADALEAGFHDLFSEKQADGMGLGAEPGLREDFERQEREADQFAAELLMPEALLRELAERAQRDGYHHEGLAERLAMEMLVSRAAMLRRLRELRIVGGTVGQEMEQAEIFTEGQTE